MGWGAVRRGGRIGDWRGGEGGCEWGDDSIGRHGARMVRQWVGRWGQGPMVQVGVRGVMVGLRGSGLEGCKWDGKNNRRCV